jgi:predicted nucleic acid-binding protein
MLSRQVSIKECGYSAITRMELLSFPGITSDEEAAIKSLLDRMAYFALTTDIENGAIEFRRQHKTKLPDAVIAATAIKSKLELLTLDKGLLAKI